MAIYEYWCPKCGKEFTLTRPMAESAEAAYCPQCGEQGQKLPSVFASKAEYSIKVPRGPAFRGREPKNSD